MNDIVQMIQKANASRDFHSWLTHWVYEAHLGMAEDLCGEEDADEEREMEIHEETECDAKSVMYGSLQDKIKFLIERYGHSEVKKDIAKSLKDHEEFEKEAS